MLETSLENNRAVAKDEIPSNLIAMHRRRAKSDTATSDGPTILVVDDERVIADTTAEILGMSGFRAVAAYDGRTALELAREIRPDFLLTDVVMPGMSGIELAVAVKKVEPDTTVLLFSGQAATRELLDEVEWANDSFELVLKPVHPEELIAHLRLMQNR
ncbi:MAG: response regulator [Acidobacteriaceae bacterium]